MIDLVVSLDEGLTESLKKMARAKSLPLDTFVAEYLAGLAKQHRARKRLRELVANSSIPLDPNWKWNREELYDRTVFCGHERDPVRDDRTDE